MTPASASAGLLSSSFKPKTPVAAVVRWAMVFLVAIVIMGLTQLLKRDFTHSKINLIYNQFYVVKDLAFLSSFSNAVNWLLNAEMLAGQNRIGGGVAVDQGNGPGLPDTLKVTEELLGKVDRYTFSMHSFVNFFSEPDTLELVKGMRVADNCKLLVEARVKCSDATARTVFKNGLQAYLTSLTFIYKQLWPKLKAAATGQGGGAGQTSLIEKTFFSLQTLVFP